MFVSFFFFSFMRILYVSNTQFVFYNFTSVKSLNLNRKNNWLAYIMLNIILGTRSIDVKINSFCKFPIQLIIARYFLYLKINSFFKSKSCRSDSKLVSETAKIRARIGKIGGQFWQCFSVFWYGIFRWPKSKNRGPNLRNRK